MPQPENATKQRTAITVRKLAALDIVLHGPRLIVAEFAFSVALGGALGVFVTYTALVREHGSSPFLLVFGFYLLTVALNYVPLLLYAVAIARRNSAREEVAFELAHRDEYVRRYSLWQLLLVVPLVMPILAVVQAARHHKATASE